MTQEEGDRSGSMKEGDGRNVKEEDWSGNVRGREKEVGRERKAERG